MSEVNVSYPIGVDTIRVSIDAPHLDVSVFPRRHSTSSRKRSGDVQSEKYTIGSTDLKGAYQPRATYYPNRAILTLELSIPRYQLGTNAVLVDDHEQFIHDLDRWVAHNVSMGFSVGDAKINRIDYAVDWQVGRDMPQYIAAFEKLNLSRHGRRTFDGDGVSFISKQRVIRFYNKDKESGMDLRGQLRFEVQNNSSAIRYMCERWWNIPRTLNAWLDPTVAAHVLCYWFHQLGAHNLIGEARSVVALQNVFGSRFPQATTYLELIRQHGSDAVKLGYMSASTYSRYRREAAAHGLLSAAADDLPLLKINGLFISGGFTAVEPKNLIKKKLEPEFVRVDFPKNFRKIFQEVMGG